MSSRAFDFRLGNSKCWAQGHPNTHPSVTLALRAVAPFPGGFDVSVSLTAAEAHAMAVALEAAAVHAESVVADTGLGEAAAA